jgi:hypothetical protein
MILLLVSYFKVSRFDCSSIFVCLCLSFLSYLFSFEFASVRCAVSVTGHLSIDTLIIIIIIESNILPSNKEVTFFYHEDRWVVIWLISWFIHPLFRYL